MAPGSDPVRQWMQPGRLGDNYDRLMERPRRLSADCTRERHRPDHDVAEPSRIITRPNPFVTGETIVIDGGYAATT